MYQFNIKVEPEIMEDLCLNENTVIESYFSDGKITVRILDDEEVQDFDHTPCDICPNFCRRLDICIAAEKLK